MSSKVATSGISSSRRNNTHRDPPPPPPPNPPPSKRAAVNSSAVKNHSAKAQDEGYHDRFDSWNDASVSSRDSGHGTSSSRSSHRPDHHGRPSTNASRSKQPDAGAKGGRSLVAPPPPPPPGPPPTATSTVTATTSTTAVRNVHQKQEDTKSSQMKNKNHSSSSGTSPKNSINNSSSNRSSRDNHKNHSKTYTTMDHRDDRDRDVSLVGEEDEEEESIETHTLQYGHDGTPSVHSQSTRESAADRRRRRALEHQQQHERSLARDVNNSKSGSRSKNEEATGHIGESSVASTATDDNYGTRQGHSSSYSPRHRGGVTNDNAGKDASYYDDPPLELYSEESEEGSNFDDDSDHEDGLKRHSPHKAINVKSKEKKKSGFSRVKNLIRMGVSEDFYVCIPIAFR